MIDNRFSVGLVPFNYYVHRGDPGFKKGGGSILCLQTKKGDRGVARTGMRGGGPKVANVSAGACPLEFPML